MTPYIPTAVSVREGALLQKYAARGFVVETGALLGYSTIQLARTADRVISIDRHSGYTHWRNDTLRQFQRNLDVCGVSQRVTPVVGDFSLMAGYAADFAFIDLDGQYTTTLQAIRLARAPYIGIHDYGRTSCRGVERAVHDSGLEVVERVDSLVILRGRV